MGVHKGQPARGKQWRAKIYTKFMHNGIATLKSSIKILIIIDQLDSSAN